MRRIGICVIAMLFIASLPGQPVTAEEWKPSPGGFVSGSVEWVTTVPVDAGTAIDAVIHGDTMVVTSWKGFSTYDVSEPLRPRLLHTEVVGPHLINEQPQTNGEILLVSNDAWQGSLEIWDISDPAAPQHIGQFLNPAPAGSKDHIWTCVARCAFAYGSHGTIVDLSDPTAPKKVGDWKAATGKLRGYHHIDEVAPGKVLVGGLPVVLLDAKANPAAPSEVTRFEPHSRPVAKPFLILGGHSPSVPARVDWPRRARDRFVLVGMESPFSGSCSKDSATFGTFDAKQGFELVDEYGLEGNGLYSEGKAPTNFWGCSTYGFEVHPRYRRTRVVGLTAMEHGVRVLSVSKRNGRITELGGFVPSGGSSATVRWANDEVLYSIDLHRGIDVLRVRP